MLLEARWSESIICVGGEQVELRGMVGRIVVLGHFH